MAIIRNGFIVGRIGDTIFREVKKQQLAQAAPAKEKVNQTKETQKAAHYFGKASKLGMRMRTMLEYLTIDMYDGGMVNRLNKELRFILSQCRVANGETYVFHEKSFNRLNGFEFNINSEVKNSLWVNPIYTLELERLHITLPELKIKEELKFPNGTSSCTIHFQIRAFNLQEGRKSYYTDIHSIKVDSAQTTLEQQQFSFPVPPGCLCVVGISLRYYILRYGVKESFNTKLFHPAGISAAIMTPGVFKNEDEWRWGNEDADAAFPLADTNHPPKDGAE